MLSAPRKAGLLREYSEVPDIFRKWRIKPQDNKKGRLAAPLFPSQVYADQLKREWLSNSSAS